MQEIACRVDSHRVSGTYNQSQQVDMIHHTLANWKRGRHSGTREVSTMPQEILGATATGQEGSGGRWRRNRKQSSSSYLDGFPNDTFTGRISPITWNSGSSGPGSTLNLAYIIRVQIPKTQLLARSVERVYPITNESYVVRFITSYRTRMTASDYAVKLCTWLFNSHANSSYNDSSKLAI